MRGSRKNALLTEVCACVIRVLCLSRIHPIHTAGSERSRRVASPYRGEHCAIYAKNLIITAIRVARVFAANRFQTSWRLEALNCRCCRKIDHKKPYSSANPLVYPLPGMDGRKKASHLSCFVGLHSLLLAGRQNLKIMVNRKN